MANFKNYIDNIIADNTVDDLNQTADSLNNKPAAFAAVWPSFPKQLRNHDLLPLPLIKIANWLIQNDYEVELIKLGKEYKEPIIKPNIVFISSLYTYWCSSVKKAVSYSHSQFPGIPTVVGGIYASLMPEHCKNYTKTDYVYQGTIPEVDNGTIDARDYLNQTTNSLVTSSSTTTDSLNDILRLCRSVDYQILHTTCSCIRNCDFCGTYIIEPDFTYKKSIKDEIFKKNIIFYDNNILANPYIENILDELAELKKSRIIKTCESQSGFDTRLLINNPHLASKLKLAGFKNIKLAWDGPYSDKTDIEK
jgi:radical SAM superfamily enzyme YgiQ (UPF0313 family)